MSQPRYADRMHVIDLFRTSHNARYKQLTKCVDNETIRALLEIVLNVYKGDVVLSGDDVVIFKKYAHVFKKLTSVKSTLPFKRTLQSDNTYLIGRILRVFNTSLK